MSQPPTGHEPHSQSPAYGESRPPASEQRWGQPSQDAQRHQFQPVHDRRTQAESTGSQGFPDQTQQRPPQPALDGRGSQGDAAGSHGDGRWQGQNQDPHRQGFGQQSAAQAPRQGFGASPGQRFTPASPALSRDELDRAAQIVSTISDVFASRVVGQENLRLTLLASLAAGGHVLLESVPGLAKTTAASALARAIGGSFHRIQCTPDLMPNDIIGTQIFNYGTNTFTTQLGPVHANIVLLDEINRSSAKTQSAMLEAMQERQTSIGGEVFPLPEPFMVLATQNPIEEEGTYVLPEAQMDRFLIKEVLTYPRPGEEHEILDRSTAGMLAPPKEDPAEAVSLEDIRFLQEAVDRVHVDDAVKRYIVDLVFTTRGSGPRPVRNLTQSVRVGASPRGSLALMRVGQAHALLDGRDYVTPDDVRAMRYGVLRHRLVLTFDALASEVTPEQVIDAVFDAVPMP